MQLTDRMSNKKKIVNGKVIDEPVGFVLPALSDAIKMVHPINMARPILCVERENEILKKIGFGFYDIQQAFIENLAKSYDRNYVKIFESYLAAFDRNLKTGTAVSFFGANGSGKTNGMATMAREIIRRRFNPNLGVDGRVDLSIMFTTCYAMIEDYLGNNLGNDNIYSVVRLLMIDDVDRDYTGHRRSAFQFIIGERARYGKPFFITTALSNNEFAAQFPHAFSRMKTGIILQTKNSDLRSLRK
jgi:hypothetical protein